MGSLSYSYADEMISIKPRSLVLAFRDTLNSSEQLDKKRSKMNVSLRSNYLIQRNLLIQLLMSHNIWPYDCGGRINGYFRKEITARVFGRIPPPPPPTTTTTTTTTTPTLPTARKQKSGYEDMAVEVVQNMNGLIAKFRCKITPSSFFTSSYR